MQFYAAPFLPSLLTVLKSHSVGVGDRRANEYWDGGGGALMEWYWPQETYRRKTCAEATMSTTNPTWAGLGFRSGLRCERPVARPPEPRHGTAFWLALYDARRAYVNFLVSVRLYTSISSHLQLVPRLRMSGMFLNVLMINESLYPSPASMHDYWNLTAVTLTSHSPSHLRTYINYRHNALLVTCLERSIYRVFQEE
jgi:hypothetical protein